jgi:hypothetical protein
MSDGIERIQEESPFRCVSVKQGVNEKKQDGCHEFGKNKKGKKDEKKQSKQSVPTVQEASVDTQGTAQGDHEKILAEENQCGNIIDIEV